MELSPMPLFTVTVIAVVSCLVGVMPQSSDDDLYNIQCENMTPLNYDPNPINLEHSECPYKLEVKTSPVVPGDLVNITLKSIYKFMPFKAFMVQVRDANDTVIGAFLPPCERQRNSEYHQAINCTNGPEINNTVIQLNRRFKPSDEITWLAPVSLKGSIRFSYTVIYDEQHYWVNQKSDEVPVSEISEEDFRVKTYIHFSKLEWYMKQFYRKNCYGPYE